MTPQEKIKLLPCPFCGGEAELIEREERSAYSCKKCNCWGPDNGDDESTSIEEAKDLWNTRAATEQIGISKLTFVTPESAAVTWILIQNDLLNGNAAEARDRFMVFVQQAQADKQALEEV